MANVDIVYVYEHWTEDTPNKMGTLFVDAMNQKSTYPNIDMQQTGRKLKHMLESAGYTPRMIQDHLHLSCVQPIYRWYKGLILPSVQSLVGIDMNPDLHYPYLMRVGKWRGTTYFK